MDWKSIAKHAALLLVAGIAVGFIEGGCDFTAPRLYVTAFLVGELVSLLAYTAIFAHMAYRLTIRPWLSAVLAALLTEGSALTVLSLIPGALSSTPRALLQLELATLSAALIAGTVLGTRMRCNQLPKARSAVGAQGDAR